MTAPNTRSAWWRLGRLITGVLAAVGFVGACDLQNIAELEPGVSTEADVREKFGQPEAVWDGEEGAQIYEYNRQPEGVVNYMITIGPDGVLVKVSQVLTEENFAMAECFDGGSDVSCPLADNCDLNGALREALGAFFEVLDSYTIADLASKRKHLRDRLGLKLEELTEFTQH